MRRQHNDKAIYKLDKIKIKTKMMEKFRWKYYVQICNKFENQDKMPNLLSKST
jgi:hypothetical protein